MFAKLSTRARRIFAFLGTAIVLSCVCLLILIALPSPEESTPTPIAQQVTGTGITASPPAISPTLIPTDEPTVTPTATRNSIYAGMVFNNPANINPYPAPGSDQGWVPAQVVRVIDGDTIEVDIGGQTYRLRYIGIDAPESGDQLSTEATQANRDLVEGKTVYLESDASNTDRYDRLLRYVYLADGTFVNAELVRRGLAIAKAYPPDTKYQRELDGLQDQAQAESLGLWAAISAPTVVPPVAESPTENPPEPQAGDVQIVRIFYDGAEPRVEGDEYAEIQNVGGAAVNLQGWRLNAGNPGQDFRFPGFTMEPGQVCRIYTDEVHPDSCGFSFGSGQALWNNNGDCGYLHNNEGLIVSEYCY